MKFLLAAILLVVAGTNAYAYCATQTYISGGRMVVCTVCCQYGGFCTTTCN